MLIFLFFGLLAASQDGSQEPFDLEAALQAGLRAYERREFGEAARVWKRGAVESRKAGDDLFLGSFLGNLGIVYSVTRDYREAIGHYVEALAIAERVNDRAGEKNRRNNLAGLYLLTRKPAEALEQLDLAIALAGPGDEALAIRMQCNAAQALAQLGRAGDARERVRLAEKRLAEAEFPDDARKKLESAIARAIAAIEQVSGRAR